MWWRREYLRLPVWLWAISVPIVVGAIVTNAGDDDEPADDPAGPACAEFILAVNDLQDGILTDDEFRERMRPVVELSAGTRVEQDMRDVLAGVTQGDPDGAAAAIRGVAPTCRAAIR